MALALLLLGRPRGAVQQRLEPLGCRLRNAVVRRLSDRAQRRQLEPLVRHEL